MAGLWLTPTASLPEKDHMATLNTDKEDCNTAFQEERMDTVWIQCNLQKSESKHEVTEWLSRYRYWL